MMTWEKHFAAHLQREKAKEANVQNLPDLSPRVLVIAAVDQANFFFTQLYKFCFCGALNVIATV